MTTGCPTPARRPPASAGARRRGELGDFLRTRRHHLVRSELGLPPVARRRATGLRREEIATLSGVSVTWYTWLEQGRDIHPSRQVLDALARTMRLTPAEHTYLLSLAGHALPAPGPGRPADPAPGSMEHLLDALEGSPAFTIGVDWSVTAWNRAYTALYPAVRTLDPGDRNLLWSVFTDPAVRDLLPDWATTSRRFLAEFRAEAGPRLHEPACARVVDRLLRASAEFREGWESHDIEGFTSRERVFRTPAGILHFEHHRLAPSDHPELHLVIYTAVPGTGTAELMRQLLDVEGDARAEGGSEPGDGERNSPPGST
ncbi:MAG: Transcriptional regulator [Actinomycetota bacterium]|nr:Transcriptional regulator [Actinomycetota bacterium]